jgi:RNA polymerase-binding transcription factor DksA
MTMKNPETVELSASGGVVMNPIRSEMLALILLKQTDLLCKRHFHQNVREIMGDLQVRSGPVPEDDPRGTLQILTDAGILNMHAEFNPIRQAVKNLDEGKLAVCDGCGTEIPIHELAEHPFESVCGRCRLARTQTAHPTQFSFPGNGL